MGWASGSELAERIEKAFKGISVPEAVWREVANAFLDHDCDTLEECSGPIGDAANRLTAERHRAPKSPTAGDTHVNKWFEIIRFDGKRWQPMED